VDEGVRYQDIVEFQPTLYLKSKTKTDYKSLAGDYLTPVKQPSIKDTRKFLDKYKDVDGFNVYGNESPVYQYLADNFPGKIEFSMKDVKIFYIDIETTSEYGGVDVEAAQEQILLITIFDYNSKKSITFGSRQFSKKLDNNHYVECANEQDLLEKFLQFWEKRYPDVVSGWNIETFDIPYLVKRIQKTLGSSDANRLSPWKFVRQKNIIDRKTNKENEAYDIYGVNVLDYLPYFKKYAGTNVENHRLDTVTTEVLGESKIDHAEYETFAEFYTKDWDLFVEYNIVDTVLIDKLESKMRLLQLAMTLALDSKVNPDDTLSQGRMWDSIIYNYLLEKNVIIPTKKQNTEKTEKFKGAFVKPPQLGKFDWVASFDVSSLYPSIIRSYNISPETLIKEKNDDMTVDSVVESSFNLKPEHLNNAVCANGSMYRKDFKGFLPKIMEEMFNERSKFKKKMIESQKVLEEINKELNKRKS
jgi:DNA polymerase elongation subunit (family B)